MNKLCVTYYKPLVYLSDMIKVLELIGLCIKCQYVLVCVIQHRMKERPLCGPSWREASCNNFFVETKPLRITSTQCLEVDEKVCHLSHNTLFSLVVEEPMLDLLYPAIGWLLSLEFILHNFSIGIHS